MNENILNIDSYLLCSIFEICFSIAVSEFLMSNIEEILREKIIKIVAAKNWFRSSNFFDKRPSFTQNE